MRGFCILALMVALSACASTTASDQPLAKFQNAVYRVGEQPAPMPASAKSEEAKPADGMQAPSKPMHIYWFLSGR
jgi:hypothetical protein